LYKRILFFLLVFINTAILCIPLWFFLKKKSKDVFEPIYASCAYIFLIFIIRSIYIYINGSPFLGHFPFDNVTYYKFIQALLLVFFSTLILIVGYYSKFGKIIALKLPKKKLYWKKNNLFFMTFIFMFISLSSFYLLLKKIGGLRYYLLNKHEVLTLSGTTFLKFGINFLIYTVSIYLIYFLITKKYKHMYILVLLLSLTYGFFSGSKSIFLGIILSNMIIYHYLKKRIKLTQIIIFILIVLIVFPFFNIYRNLDNFNDLKKGFKALTQITTIMNSFLSRFHDIDSLTYILRDTPNTMKFQYGKTILKLFVAWIPRSLWENKPIISFAKIFGETYYAEFFKGTGTAPSPTLIGEAYINFHIIGSFIISYIIGVFLRFIYEYLINKKYSFGSIFLYSQIFLSLSMIWESDIVPSIINILMIIFISIFVNITLSIKLR